MDTVAKLPAPTQDQWEWQYEGACRDADPDLFFHPEGERGSARRRRAEAAKEYCERCPVLDTCRERSLMAREPFGVWGGMSEDERHAMLAGRLKKAS
ncbi:WhiB family transcriptional regulator [Demequina activiva]|uniref:Transcriptional regulator WhiB n=1 Tax=Demequina activiva TaxID=1582364 RepID=A0A919Q379_9MICO|nr:WhiB family transcriptional regulator [Demequina activiva]GIG54779.1 redox-responsive probable transcriptional regulator WhiB3 [Demequina activiva]